MGVWTILNSQLINHHLAGARIIHNCGWRARIINALCCLSAHFVLVCRLLVSPQRIGWGSVVILLRRIYF